MDKRMPAFVLCLAAESMGLFAATGVVLIAAVVVYLIYRTRNKRE